MAATQVSQQLAQEVTQSKEKIAFIWTLTESIDKKLRGPEPQDGSEDLEDDQERTWEYFYQAVYDFQAPNEEVQLSFQAGDTFQLISRSTDDDGWWAVRDDDGNEGLVPFNYVQLSCEGAEEWEDEEDQDSLDLIFPSGVVCKGDSSVIYPDGSRTDRLDSEGTVTLADGTTKSFADLSENLGPGEVFLFDGTVVLPSGCFRYPSGAVTTPECLLLDANGRRLEAPWEIPEPRSSLITHGSGNSSSKDLDLTMLVDHIRALERHFDSIQDIVLSAESSGSSEREFQELKEALREKEKLLSDKVKELAELTAKYDKDMEEAMEEGRETLEKQEEYYRDLLAKKDKALQVRESGAERDAWAERQKEYESMLKQKDIALEEAMEECRETMEKQEAYYRDLLSQKEKAHQEALESKQRELNLALQSQETSIPLPATPPRTEDEDILKSRQGVLESLLRGAADTLNSQTGALANGSMAGNRLVEEIALVQKVLQDAGVTISLTTPEWLPPPPPADEEEAPSMPSINGKGSPDADSSDEEPLMPPPSTNDSAKLRTELQLAKEDRERLMKLCQTMETKLRFMKTFVEENRDMKLLENTLLEQCRQLTRLLEGRPATETEKAMVANMTDERLSLIRKRLASVRATIEKTRNLC